MHLILDILVNVDNELKSPVLFYLLSYRAAQKFAAKDLLDVVVPAEAGKRPIREFFKWKPFGGHASTEYAAERDETRTSV